MMIPKQPQTSQVTFESPGIAPTVVVTADQRGAILMRPVIDQVWKERNIKKKIRSISC